jgi:hypothetical protein
MSQPQEELPRAERVGCQLIVIWLPASGLERSEEGAERHCSNVPGGAKRRQTTERSDVNPGQGRLRASFRANFGASFRTIFKAICGALTFIWGIGGK